MDKLIKELTGICKASVHIDINPFKAYYESAEEWFDHEANDDVIGELDLTKDIYVVQAYPKTPVGFIRGVSNDLETLLKWAIEASKDYYGQKVTRHWE